MADKFLTVDFCCNDPHNGAFRGVFDGFQIENTRGDELRGDCLMLDDEQAPTLAFEPGFVVVNGRRYPKRGQVQGRGNWCWTSVMMTPGDVVALLKQLEHLSFWFDDDDASEFDELHGFILDLARKAGGKD